MALNNITSSLVIVASMLGYGIIALPVSWAKVGYLCAFILLMMCALITYLSVELIFRASVQCVKNNKDSNKSADVSYFSLIEEISPLLGNITTGALIIFLFLITIAYLNTGMDFGEKMFCLLFNKTVPRYAIATGFIIVEYLLTFLKDLSYLQSLSTVSVGSCLFVGALCVRYAFLKPVISTTAIDFTGVHESIGTFVFALGCAPIIPSVYMNLSKKANTSIIAIFSIFLGALICSIVGFSGYFCAGDQLKASINGKESGTILDFLLQPDTEIRKSISSSSFDKNGYCINIAVCLFFFILMNTYALQFYTARDCIMGGLIRFFKSCKGTETNKISTKIVLIARVIDIVYVSATAIIAIFCFPGSLLNWAGIIFGNYLGFFLPAICYIGICGKNNKLWYSIAIGIIIFSIVSASYSITLGLISK
ncbi:putative sodium-coupled neutral amino acid transporter 8 [Cucumispora dikerogammari]|nr:putative sodium-coupled neutral amino acid transporter 8 [Cucumispora dikerogammari]